jgi:hypothetical protein
MIYKQKIEKLPGAKWLDFFDKLLTDDQKNLKDIYTMDGTHINPIYISLLEKSLQNC